MHVVRPRANVKNSSQRKHKKFAGFQCYAIKVKSLLTYLPKQIKIIWEKKEGKYIVCKDSCQVSGHNNFTYARYAEKYSNL